MEKTIWHNLRTKPASWEYVLVETSVKRYPFRICYYIEESGYWMDAYKTSYYIPKTSKFYRKGISAFKVKRWAYLKDIVNL